MNKLSAAQRAQILGMLCEGVSMRAISRLADVSINTVTKLLVDAGLACARFHDENVRGVRAKFVQCDEIWRRRTSERQRRPRSVLATYGRGPHSIAAPK
jgi:lambda repressor-like predicted transcriptional regulator